MNNIGSELLFKYIECPKALFLHRENFEFRDYDKSVECVDPIIRKSAMEWFGSSRDLHQLSNQTLSVQGVSEKIAFVTEVDGEFVLENLLFTGSVRDRDKQSLALQVWLLAQNGVDIDKVYLYLPRKDAVFGESFDEIFCVEDVTINVFARSHKVENGVKMLQLPADPVVNISINCLAPYSCGFNYICFENLPKNSILNLARMRKERRFELFRQGVTTTSEIPEGIRFSRYQEIQIEAERDGKAVVDLMQISQFLAEVEYPIYFLDFETIQHSIAPFEGLAPHEPLPFQYSLHILHGDGALEHFDFLAEASSDARCEIAMKLAKEIGDHGTIFAYGAEYERRILRRLAGWCVEYENELTNFADRVLDLMKPFEKRWYYHPDMQGSFSLKSVAPIFDKTIDYKELDIGAGFDALKKYMELGLQDQRAQEKTREDLLQYGFYDTYSLVQIFKALKRVRSD